MQLSPPAVDPARTQQYTERLAAARDELASVRQAPLDTPQGVDDALGHLFGATATIHEALAGAGTLPDTIPGGATSFPRTAAAHLHDAAHEVARATTGSPVDQVLVERNVQAAIARLQQAIGLVVHPPSGLVHDGS